MRAALDAVRKTLGQKYPLVIDGEKIWTTNTIASINPSNPDQVVGYQAHAEIPEAERAVVAAKKAFASWRRTTFEERAQLLERVAAIMERRRYELSALEVFEVGKAWVEADGDIREAMDFCLFYANQMRRIGRPKLTQHVPGEESYHHYWPRGISLVIAPWNFPLAILTGMVTAALVTGNTVIMKPAEQSAIVAYRLMEMMEEAGIPPGVLNLLTGKGSVIGAHLVDHKDIAMIAFTGSREVGLRIWKSAGETRPGQEELKHVVCEMGGKNAIIIDSDADLDEAIVDTIYSAFGYQGQKCSACSRLIVLEENYDRVIERLGFRCGELARWKSGRPRHHGGPGDRRGCLQKHSQIHRDRKIGGDARLSKNGRARKRIFRAANDFHKCPARFSHRLRRDFRPVLSVIKVRDLDEAIAAANSTEFALTAGFFSRSPANIDRAKAEIVAGNVYINRSCTGAVVGRHPFGGFKMSGGGTKAGGVDYLLNFVVPRVVTENIMRHGFAPESTPEYREEFLWPPKHP